MLFMHFWFTFFCMSFKVLFLLQDKNSFLTTVKMNTKLFQNAEDKVSSLKDGSLLIMHRLI